MERTCKHPVLWAFALVLACSALPQSYAEAALPSLIPRSVLFGNPVKTSAKISPNAKHIGYLAPSAKGVMNVWIQAIGKKKARMVTNDKKRGIRIFFWAYDNRHLLYIQDKAGDENWHLYAVDLTTNKERNLTPFPKVRVTNIMANKKFPGQLLISLNKRNRRLFDIHRLDLKSGKLTLDTKNPGGVLGWKADSKFVVRAHIAMNPRTGGRILRVRDGKKKPWRAIVKWPFGEQGGIVGFTKDNKSLYIRSTLGSNTSRLLQINASTGKLEKVLAQHPKSDLGGVYLHPDTRKVIAVGFHYKKPEWRLLDQTLKADFDYLKTAKRGHFAVISADRSHKHWIIVYYADNGPASFYHYIKGSKKLRFLFTNRPALKKYKLAKMQPIVIISRDKKQLVSYLTLPLGVKAKKLPMVLLVHGGPWARDRWGYRSATQWLANRGYAVLQVNFRGSAGFGKAFLNAGDKQWGVGTMQHDLTDAVAWAVKKGIADPKRVAIMGGSYGGYATLAGLVFTPKLYACGVDIVGPSNLQTLLRSIPPYWKPMKRMLTLRVGPVEADKAFNRKVSPLFHAHKIKVPLLIGHGANDPRVKLKESNQIVATMRKNKRKVTYIVYPDEGHGFRRPPNKLDFFGRTEVFLGKCLKGRHQPWKKIKGATGQSR